MPESKYSRKVGDSITYPWQKVLVDWLTPRVPKGIETYHLTLMTIPFCLGMIVFGYLARTNIHWLWGSSLMLILQWLTDCLDGAVGRYRNTGLVKWGFYMDHLLDYFFLCSILIGYLLVLPSRFYVEEFFILAIFGGFMVNSYLMFASTNEFRITYLGLGPTEMRLVFVIVNTLIILFGKTHLASLLPWVLGFSFLGLCYVIYRNQEQIWLKDMEDKKEQQ